ncbi:hypothetical protein O1611_g2139 [Lasiodiplodia mahajangana]|uniref:Uncharacterized protein n=1 Tax=Lasiodiplodia mahajangana TaxID=1108764 RepID=A0ACC2JVI1_9PEZI|nr:hypothetical protein O1611_g2139 [Lasiodiplodia mahajangana]
MTQQSVDSQAPAIPPVQTGTGPLKLRSACNRCHEQKLRCIRSVRTAPGVMLEPRDLAPAAVVSVLSDSAGCGWPPLPSIGMSGAEDPGHPDSDPGALLQLDLAELLATDSHQLCRPLSSYALDYDDNGVAHHTMPVHQDAMGDEAVNYLSPSLLTPSQVIPDHNNEPGNGLVGSSFTCTARRLTSLNSALYECASKLPSIKPSLTGSVGIGDTPRVMNGRAREAALLALDEVFHATTEFINIMKDLLPTSEIRTLTTVTSVTPNCHYFIPEVSTAAPLLEHSPRALLESSLIDPFPHLDEATIFLFLSCHCRLIDIYESIFQAMQRCIAGSHAASHSTGGIILPQLRIGGVGGVSSPALRVDFNGPRLPPATISMYMALITTLSAQLWAQVREALARGTGCHGLGNQASLTNPVISDATWDIAMQRTDDMSQTITAVQHLL